MSYVVYRITCKLDGKSYIGATSDVAKRWGEHRRNAKAGIKDFLLYEAMRSQGVENFYIETLSIHNNKRAAFDAEIQAIKLHGTVEPNGYNMRVMGRALPEEHAEKIRIALRQEDVRQVISRKLTAISNTPEMRLKRATFTGKHHTAEARQRIGEAKKGKPQSAEHIAALSAVRKGKVRSIENRIKVAKLTETNVRMIKTCLAAGDKKAEIAAGFGVSYATIVKIERGQSWQWVIV